MNNIKNIDGKKVIIKGNPKNIPPINIIRKIYNKIPDDKKIPIVFETKTQYLNEYIKNQEKARGRPFPKKDIEQYKSTELKHMANIVSRYTTKHNPYIDVRTVFFTDKKVTPTQFTKSAFHEYGHEAWETKPGIRKDWKALNKNTAPTPYGRTARQEDFAESYMLYKTKKLEDPIRQTIIKNDTIGQSRYDFSEFDMNNDGKIDDKDINIMRKMGMLKGLKRDNTGRDSVADALGWGVPVNVLESASWKLYGAPKKYDPRYAERGDLKGNIYKLTKAHYTALGKNPFMYQGLVSDQVAQNFGLFDTSTRFETYGGEEPSNIPRAIKSAYLGSKDPERAQIHLTPKPVRKGIQWAGTKYRALKKFMAPVKIDRTKPIPGAQYVPKWLTRVSHPITTAVQAGVIPNPDIPIEKQLTTYVPAQELTYTPAGSTDVALYESLTANNQLGVPKLGGGIYEKKPWIITPAGALQTY